MRKILLAMMMVFSMGALAAEEIKPIVFEDGNFFAITTQFDNKLLDNFTEKVLNHEEDNMYIYFDTPGGSVIALSRMARIMKSSKINFTCVANFAASAGFMLFQHCQHRYLLSDGVLMSHNWAGTFSDEGPRILTMFNTIQSIVNNLEEIAIKKMNVDAVEYAALINNNLWMTRTLATQYSAIDGVTDDVTCSRKLIKQKNPLRVRTGWTSWKTFYRSGCPLIQKLYAKDKSSNDYVDAGMTQFQFAQKDYKMGQANWIYMGVKPE